MKKGLTIFILSFIIYFVLTPILPLRNWDEAWYAEIIKNMVGGQHSLLVPFWQGQYYFDKPPLYFWLSLPLVKTFGLEEWTVRLVSVIAASFCSVLIYQLANRLFKGYKNIGFYSVLLFMTFGQVYVRFSHGNIDSLLIALFLATYYFWLKGGKSYWLSGLCLGLGFLVKGWTLGLFPLFVIALHSWLKDRQLMPKGLIYIIVGAILSSVWWYIAGCLTFGSDFYNWYIFTPAEGSLSLNSFTFEPFKYLLRDLGIWLLLPFMFVLRYPKKVLDNLKDLLPFAICTVIFLLGLSFAKEKLDWHNLPVYPLVAFALATKISLFKETYKRTTPILVGLFVIAQIIVIYNIENIYPDRSRVGAELGYMMTVVKTSNDIVILDDHDFTSFLYYSNVGKVYVVSQEGGKPGEYWTLKYSDLEKFIASHQNVVVISKDINSIYQRSYEGRPLASGYGYTFTKFNE